MNVHSYTKTFITPVLKCAGARDSAGKISGHAVYTAAAVHTYIHVYRWLESYLVDAYVGFVVVSDSLLPLNVFYKYASRRKKKIQERARNVPHSQSEIAHHFIHPS